MKRLVWLVVAVAVFFLSSDLTCSTSATVIAKYNTSQTKSNVTAATVYYNLTIIIENPLGGWTIPKLGIHTYPANTTVTIYWYHTPWYGLAYYDINGTIAAF